MVTVGTTWINNFTGVCCQPRLYRCDNAARGFGDGMRRKGHSWKFDKGNSYARERNFRDSASGGTDTNKAGGVDSVDFAYLATHGSWHGDHFRAYFGSQCDNCSWNSSQAKLGNRNLEWLVLDTCQSLQLPIPHLAWLKAFHGLHMIFGFTFNVTDRGGRGSRFGRRAGDGARLADAWLDEAYSYWFKDYPVVLACGRSSYDSWLRINYERITSGYDDIPNNQIKHYRIRFRF